MSSRQCLLIAPLVSHATAGRIAALVNTDYSVSLLDVSAREIRFGVDQYPYNKLKRIHALNAMRAGYFRDWSHVDQLRDVLRSRGMLAEDPPVMDSLREILRSENPDVVVTYYGPIGLHFSRLVKRINPRQRVVFIANLAPSTILGGNSVAKAIKGPFVPEFVDYKVWLNELDFIVCASEEMSGFLQREYSCSADKLAVLPDFLPRTFQVSGSSDVSLAAERRNPQVIFLGAPERWGGEIDRLDTEFAKFERAGIDVYVSSGQTHRDSRNSYPYFSDDDVFSGKLSDYAHRFDAALVLYNWSTRHERFRSTLPTRFFSSLAAALPVVVKGGMFDAVENFVREYSIGCTFESADDLHAVLTNKKALSECRDNVRRLLPVFSAESQSEKLQHIFDTILRA